MEKTLCIFLFLYFESASKNLPLYFYIVIKKINPQEFPRNPVNLSKIKRVEICDAAQSFLETAQKTFNEYQLQLAQLFCVTALQYLKQR